MSKIRIVFDGPPGPESGRFVEVEDEDGNSISVGTWESSQAFTGPKWWHLVLDDPRESAALRARVQSLEETLHYLHAFFSRRVPNVTYMELSAVVAAALRRDGETP